MKKLYYLILVAILATAFSCMNSRFTNPSKYIKYAGQVNGGGSGGNNGPSGGKVVYNILTINILGDGYVIVGSDRYVSELKLLKNTRVEIEAIAENGKTFQGWSGSITSLNPVEEIVMDKDITLTASFVIPTVYKKLILTIRKGGGVEIDGVMHRNNAETNISVIEEYEEGKIVSLKAIPNDPNISFGGWSGSLESENKTITVTLTDTITLSASFSADKYITINNTPDSYVEINVANSPITKHTNETIEVKVEVGDEVHITAKANNKRTHEFVKWAGSILSTIPNINTTITGDLSLILEFKQVMKTLTININDSSFGNITVSGTIYTSPREIPIDSDVIVLATRSKNYAFDKWSGNTNTTSRQVVMKMDDNKTLNASFINPIKVYSDSSINFESTKFDSWLIEASFDNDEFPTYHFKNISGKSWGSGDANYNEYKYSGADTKAAGQNVKSVIYYQYRGINYYHKRDHADNDYNKPPHSDKLSRFYFYRFSGNPLGQQKLAIDNAMCVIDTYTKLIFAYSIPTEFKIINLILTKIRVPTKWEALEAVNPRGENLKFYEYDPIGYVKSDGSVQLFDSFKAIQKDAAGKGNKELYYPKTPNPENPIATHGSLANSSGRSPYY